MVDLGAIPNLDSVIHKDLAEIEVLVFEDLYEFVLNTLRVRQPQDIENRLLYSDDLRAILNTLALPKVSEYKEEWYGPTSSLCSQ